jgi:hypothetical protein
LVTRNELAWNEHLKKSNHSSFSFQQHACVVLDHNFLEVGDFKPSRILEPLYWYHPASPGRRQKKLTIAMSDELFRSAELIAQRVMTQAVNHVRDALVSLCILNPSEYIRHQHW